MRCQIAALLCSVPFIAAAAKKPTSTTTHATSTASPTPSISVTASPEVQQTFLAQISDYLSAGYALINVSPDVARQNIEQIEKPPITNLILQLNVFIQSAGLEPNTTLTTDLPTLTNLTAQVTMEDVGGYLEYTAGRIGGVTEVPNNVTDVTLHQALQLFHAGANSTNTTLGQTKTAGNGKRHLSRRTGCAFIHREPNPFCFDG